MNASAPMDPAVVVLIVRVLSSPPAAAYLRSLLEDPELIALYHRLLACISTSKETILPVNLSQKGTL